MLDLCTYCFSETAWAENRLTPTSCGAKVFSLKFRELGALTDTVGICQVFDGLKSLSFPKDLWTSEIKKILCQTPDKRELENEHAAIP